jgi:hypothetical protein
MNRSSGPPRTGVVPAAPIFKGVVQVIPLAGCMASGSFDIGV